MVLGVGAVDQNDLGTYFTNFGSWVDVSAPGLRVLSTGIDTAASATDGYGRWFGTSFSSPIVAGVAALILAQNPTWTPTQVAAQLVGTADDIYHLPGNAGYNDQLGSGRVNAFRAVSETLGLPHVVSTSTNLDYSTLDQPLTVRFSQGMDPNIDLLANGQPANFEVRYDANSDSVFAASERIDISFFDIDGAGPMPAEYVLGPTVALKLGSTNPGQYQLFVRGGVDGVHDAFGQPLGDANGNAMAEHTATFTIATGSFIKIENASIPDRGTLTSSLEIGATGTIYDVNVKLNLTHTVDEDLDVFLVAPDGTRVELFTDVGSVYDNFINTVLDDSAATAITSGTGPFTGTYRPEGSLATLNGKNLAGTWSLEVSDDTRKNTGELLDWSLIARTTPLRPEILVTPTSGLLTTESGGTGSFTVSLSQAPTADVVILLNTMDYSEGQVSADSLTFTPANWSVPQTIVVTGLDDTLVDGTIAYTVFTGLASSADPAFNGLNPANVSLTNLDNDVPPTKFYVVNDGPDRTHEYSATGTPIEDYALTSGNTAPRGAASTAAGDRVWVVDANRNVYVYSPSGALLGSWTAGTLASNATVEGIATNGVDVWIVDANSDKVYRYTSAASRLSGSQTAASNFSLNSGNNSPKDIVTDGTSLWVLNDANTDKVFKYTIAGALLGSWTITNASEPSPTGITLDPANPSHLWIVGSGIDRVYQYDNSVGRTSGSQAPSTTFTLAGTNTNPQGIADPPAPKSSKAAINVHDQELMEMVAELDDFIGPRRKRG
jgi:subtilisin-like proprotein convertase family protein